jgi:tetratricopeptide (TPR) repeat protein
LTSSFNIADSLLDKGDYKKALIEYERLDFFSPSDDWKYKKAFCYRGLGRYQDAVRIFESLGDGRELIRTYILMNEYPLAEYECKKIGNKELMGWVLFLEGKWDESISIFNEIEREDVAGDIHPLPKKDIKKAQILSSIVPGLGEIYAGRPWCTYNTVLMEQVLSRGN